MTRIDGIGRENPRCKHDGSLVVGTDYARPGHEIVVCNDCGTIVKDTAPDPRIVAAIELLYAKPPEAIGAANTMLALGMASDGLKGKGR